MPINFHPMTIRISKTRTFKELQQDFNNLFPFLKIEFFKRGHAIEEGSNAQKMIRSSQLQDVTGSVKEEGLLEIQPTMTVADFEQTLLNRFGLAIQVFRKSGNLWLETTMTDQWSLKQQNEHGREISSPAENTPQSATPDYELTRGED
jgi:glycerol-3-phosphate O-acyltransferase